MQGRHGLPVSLEQVVCAYLPARWELAFLDFLGGNIWWIWPVLGLVFRPWTTIMYVIVSPGGIVGWDWLWLGLMLAADIASYTGGIGRKRLPGFEEAQRRQFAGTQWI